MVNVSLTVWEEVGPDDDKKIRVLEKKTMTVEELDFQELALVGFELGDKIIQGMLLETIGRARVNIVIN